MISDSKLSTFLQRELKRRGVKKIPNIRLCGSQANNRLTGGRNDVFVVSDGESSRYVGINCCHSIWSCPRCTPQVLAAKGEEIACAIDALKKWHNEVAVMVTFTLRHIKAMSIADTYSILLDTWRMFTRSAKNKKSYTRKDGTTAVYFLNPNIYAKWRQDLDIKHHVRVYEFTYGKNGWHPHIHALFWLPKQNLSRITELERELRRYWWHCLKSTALKLYTKKMGDKTKAETFINRLYKDVVLDYQTNPKYPEGGEHAVHYCVYISKDKNGNPIVSQSSHYVSGWSGNDELTSLTMKSARKNHMTPFQILEKAYGTTDAAERDKLVNLYIDYATATFKKTRTFWSTHSGVKDIIQKWKQTQDYVVTWKKKCVDKATATARYQVVCWFTEEQWQSICLTDMCEETYLKADILKFAKLSDGKKRIESMLLKHGIDISANGENPMTCRIEESIFENCIFNDAA